MKQKNAYLELLRFIFCVLICLYHWGKGHFRGAYVGVQFFFVLSGFMLAKSYFDNLVALRKQNIYENCLSFLKTRIIKYYPHFIFSLIVLSVIKVIILKLMTLNEFLKSLFWEITFLQNIGITVSGDLINPPAWFLCAVVICGYVIFFLLQKYQDAYVYIIAPLSVIFMFCYFNQRFGSMAAASPVILFTTSGIIQGFACMSLGCMSYVFCMYLEQKLSKDNIVFRIIQSIAEIDLLGLILLLCYKEGRTNKDFILIVFFAVLIISAALNNSLMSMVCNNYIRKLSLFCGRLSYPVFLNHMAVIICFNRFEHAGGGYTGQTVIFLLTTIIYSVITEKIVKRLLSAVKIIRIFD